MGGALSACLLIGSAAAYTTAQAAATRDVGLAVGTRAPDFTLVDQNGTSRSLESLLGSGKLAIIFYRSADW
jgi:cytochrome oxidase Cu insertion factor (SCO1/SenC/PrrC family)